LNPESDRMKCLIVYYVVSRIDIPQSKGEIVKFAAANRFVIEWRGAIPSETAQAS
jgi:hypothetical protein